MCVCVCVWRESEREREREREREAEGGYTNSQVCIGGCFYACSKPSMKSLYVYGASELHIFSIQDGAVIRTAALPTVLTLPIISAAPDARKFQAHY